MCVPRKYYVITNYRIFSMFSKLEIITYISRKMLRNKMIIFVNVTIVTGIKILVPHSNAFESLMYRVTFLEKFFAVLEIDVSL